MAVNQTNIGTISFDYCTSEIIPFECSLELGDGQLSTKIITYKL